MWPMWLRVILVPFRLIAAVLLIMPVIFIMCVNMDLGGYILAYISEKGNKPDNQIGF